MLLVTGQAVLVTDPKPPPWSRIPSETLAGDFSTEIAQGEMSMVGESMC